MGVVKPLVTRHLIADERWLLVRLVFGRQFHLGNDKTVVFAMKLVHLERVTAALHKISMLVYESAVTQGKQLLRLREVYFFFKFITCHSAIRGTSLDGEIRLVVTKAHPDRGVLTPHVALTYVAT